MSLLITSNTPKNEAGELTEGINRPYSYSNNLQDTLRIPKDSEIAVQSVKINRDGILTLDRGQRMGMFFGEEISDTGVNNDINSYLTSNSMTDEVDLTGGEDNGEDFFFGSLENIAERIQLVGNRCLCHPNLCENNVSAVNQGFTCDVKRNASTQNFEGFTYTITNTDSSKNTSNISEYWNTEDGGDYTKIGSRLTNSTGERDSAIGWGFPLSQASGTFSASIVEYGKVQEIGLTRCLGSTDDVLDQYVPPWYNKTGDDFWDWLVEIESNNELKVYNAIPDGPELNLIEYDYRWMNSGSYFNASTDEIDRVDFNVKGERVKISLFKGATEYVLTDGTNATSASNVKPTNMNTRFLFPKIRLEDGGIIDIRQFDGVDVKNFSYGNDQYGFSSDTSFEVTPFLDWWPAHFDDNEARTMDLTSVKSLNFTNQIGLNASNQIDYKTAIATGKDNRYEYSDGLNTETVLGFSGRPMAFDFKSKATVSPFIITYESDNVPELNATSSIFIRVRNMTFDSVNFSKSAMSKILYHIPSFSVTGESTGALYFEPSERVYLKLNNVVDLYLSNIDVDLVRDDETLARDVTGKTTVIFHLRPSK